jgi:hypothetical protein
MTTELDFISDLRNAFGFVSEPRQKRKYVRKTARNFKFDAERAAEMLELRYGQKWTLDKIGIKFGISRERVRQILGNTGYMGESRVDPRKARRSVQIEEIKASMSPDKTNQEVIDETGLPESLISSLRAGTRHAIKDGKASDGMQVENKVSATLTDNGIKNKLMPNKHHHDIELPDGRRVEVKARLATIQRTPEGKEKYHFTLVKNGAARERAEFFVLVSPYDTFVVPSCEIPDKTVAIDFCYPETDSGRRKSKYWQYRNRFDLLK